ncbi:hypothetical protein GYMLUDRAFT_62161 [Collybiopsis luxurians FD-317 M1]|uniref:Uncharacterized protein n=1 Tax=Collybiopsis luxurians FD-317 M1 TaxID=944289 RepID=A0A0D0BMI1_9AGAR|nr:hypothetical protein GYMLUDRAFT_62161 [Collybiopsis luxurians FD-317 M1]
MNLLLWAVDTLFIVNGRRYLNPPPSALLFILPTTNCCLCPASIMRATPAGEFENYIPADNSEIQPAHYPSEALRTIQYQSDVDLHYSDYGRDDKTVNTPNDPGYTVSYPQYINAQNNAFAIQDSQIPRDGSESTIEYYRLIRGGQASIHQNIPAAGLNPYPNHVGQMSITDQSRIAAGTSEDFQNICRYRKEDGEECGVALTPENVVAHCDPHLRRLTSSGESNKVVCRWNTIEGRACTTMLKKSDMRKHVHAKHHTIKHHCPLCGRRMTLRKDAIKGHLKKEHEYTETQAESYAAKKMGF